MLRPGGWAIIVDPTLGKPREYDTFTCWHCNSIVIVDRKDKGGFCMRCMRQICAACVSNGRCIPFEKRLARIEGKR